MGKESLTLGIGDSIVTPDGGRVGLEYKHPSYKKLDGIRSGEKAKHEAGHAGVAELTGTPVLEIDMNPPEEGAAAVTRLSEANMVSMAASLHRKGAGSDRLKLLLLGHDPESMGSLARSIEDGAKDQFEEIAIVAEAEGFVPGGRIRQAMEDGELGRPVIVSFEDGLGNRQSMETRAKGGFVKVTDMRPNTQYEIPPASPQTQFLQLAA